MKYTITVLVVRLFCLLQSCILQKNNFYDHLMQINVTKYLFPISRNQFTFNGRATVFLNPDDYTPQISQLR